MTPYHPRIDALEVACRRALHERNEARADVARLQRQLTDSGAHDVARLMATIEMLREENRVLRLANRAYAKVRA